MRAHQPPPTPHMKGDNRRQRETRPLQSPRRRPHQPTPTPHIKGDNRRQWETTGDKTTSEPKKPTTPTNTKAARSKVALRTPTVNCLGKYFDRALLSKEALRPRCFPQHWARLSTKHCEDGPLCMPGICKATNGIRNLQQICSSCCTDIIHRKEFCGGIGNDCEGKTSLALLYIQSPQRLFPNASSKMMPPPQNGQAFHSRPPWFPPGRLRTKSANCSVEAANDERLSARASAF